VHARTTGKTRLFKQVGTWYFSRIGGDLPSFLNIRINRSTHPLPHWGTAVHGFHVYLTFKTTHIVISCVMEPTFSYLDELSGDNKAFKQRIIQIIIEDLPQDFAAYAYALENQNHHRAAELVHRITQKIAFLQMNDSIKLADEHEMQLRQGNTIYMKDFSDIIDKILKFLENSESS
jgi:HPt (histidine-containing phosphotransfer) domain-containing protein